MSGNRTRGLLRAAALLAVGASPLLASTASAAEAPTDTLDSTIDQAPKVGSVVTTPVTDLLSGRALKLPAPVASGSPEVHVPKVRSAPQVPAVPSVPQVGLPLVGDTLPPQGRALPPVPALPLPAPPVAAPQLPDLAPDLGALPVQAPRIG
ncbi:hypothetical protein ACRAKI_24995 [Saccharothrix isguenensis]